MIPTMIAFGVIFGRWWKVALVVGAIAWPLVLIDGSLDSTPSAFAAAAGLGLVNTAVGVSLLAVGAWIYRHVRDGGKPDEESAPARCQP